MMQNFKTIYIHFLRANIIIVFFIIIVVVVPIIVIITSITTSSTIISNIKQLFYHQKSTPFSAISFFIPIGDPVSGEKLSSCSGQQCLTRVPVLTGVLNAAVYLHGTVRAILS